MTARKCEPTEVLIARLRAIPGPNPDPATAIVDAIVRDLRGRGGFDAQWDSLDYETESEILQAWWDIVAPYVAR